MGIVDGTIVCPSQFKRSENGVATTEIDPAYNDWQQKDQLILSWINNSLTPFVLSTVARSKSSYETWTSLEKRYASQSHNRILQLRNELFTTKGEGLSITDFVDKINHIADNLALAGKPVDDDDLISIIMNNVGSSYEATVSSAQARDTPISYDAVVALLLGAKMRLKAQNTPTLEVTPTALYTPKFRQNTNSGRGGPRGSFNRGRGRGRTSSIPPSNASSSGFSSSKSSGPVCQICNRLGHMLLIAITI